MCEPERLSSPWPAWAIATSLAAVVLPTLAALWPLLTGAEPPGGDSSSHLAQLGTMVRALEAGQIPDWNPQSNLGFPLGYYYQWLPHWIVCAVYFALLGSVPLLL